MGGLKKKKIASELLILCVFVMLTTASERRVDYIQAVNEGDLRPHCNLTLAKLYNKKLVGTDLLITGFLPHCYYPPPTEETATQSVLL